MKELQIGKNLVKLRKDKHLTQEQLATYLGISKTAVSKWETEQSYPDVTFLPIIAAYFNISIDDLIGYEPQMSKADITKLYKRICKEFVEKDFLSVYKECQDIAHKYYACHSLVYNISVLYANHAMLANDEQLTQQMYEEARTYCRHVKEESDDLKEKQSALQMEAYCNLVLNRPQDVIDLVGGIKMIESNVLLANAYYMIQDTSQALLTVQVDITQNLMSVFQAYPLFLTLHMQDREKFDEALQKLLTLDDIFHMKDMNPGLLFPIYLIAIQGYLALHEQDHALGYLELYVNLFIKGTTCFELRGYGLFDRINEWSFQEEPDIHLPRDEKVIRESCVDAILKNPMFEELKSNPRYEYLLNQLQNSIGGMNHV